MDLTREEVQERQDRALEMHLAGVSLSLIAERLGYRGKSGAHRAVNSARERHGVIGAETVATAAQTELERLDRLLVSLWPLARRGDVAAAKLVLEIGRRRMELIAERERSDDGYYREPDPHGQAQREDSLAEFRRRFEERRRAAGAD